MMTPEEEKKFIELANKIDSVMCQDVFDSIANKFVLPAIETVVLREGDNGVEVLLIERPEDDNFWPGQVHSLGTILRKSDHEGIDYSPYDKAFERIQEKEIETRFVEEPIFVASMFHKYKRGLVNSVIFVCEIEGEPSVGEFYSVDDLPQNFLDEQSHMLNVAVEFYERIVVNYKQQVLFEEVSV